MVTPFSLILVGMAILIYGWCWQREASGPTGPDKPKEPPAEKPPPSPNQ